MRITIIIALTVFSCSIGCKPSSKETNSTIKTNVIRLISQPDTIISKISSIASDIEYVPLQLTPDTRIEPVYKIILSGNKFYINLINNILCFDNKGHFLYKLYEDGKNKEESVVAIYDFDIDKADTSLIVLYGNELLLFKNSVTGFDYTKTIKLGKLSPSKLAFVPGTNKVLLSSPRVRGTEPSLSVLIDLNEKILSFKPYYFERFNPIKYSLDDHFINYQFENKLFFKERFNDTVFSLDSHSNSFTPGVILNSRLSSTNAENLKNPDYVKIMPNVVNAFEVSRYLYFEYFVGESQNHKVFYDKYENRKYEIEPTTGILKDDIAGGPDFGNISNNDSLLYSWVEVKTLKKYIESTDFKDFAALNPAKKKALEQMADSLKLTDNPILIVVTPKK